MSVVGPSSKLIFCEGKPNGLDERLLEQVALPANAVIKPSGGKQTLAVYVQVELARYQETPQYITFRDRDFDAQPPENPQLIRPFTNKPVYYTYRACIENYLLDAELIEQYWQTSEGEALTWRYGPSPERIELQNWIDEAAREIKEYQAIRWALASLKPGMRWPEVRNTWTAGDGKLPQNLDFESCFQAGQQLIEEFQSKIVNIDINNFEKSAKDYQSKFADSSFWSDRKYLIWFHGKDIQKAMQRKKPQWLSLKSFFSWAAPKVDFSKHIDLQELKRYI